MNIDIAHTPYLTVYQVIDEAAAMGSPPAGARAALCKIIDRLRWSAVPVENIRLIERVAVALHRLDWALRDGDALAEGQVRAELRTVGTAWLDTPMCPTLH